MKNTKVYDLPTRFLHWLFAGLFLGAFLIAKTVDDDSWLFSYHMLMGLTLVMVASLRIIWGFVGTEHARFRSFPLKPARLAEYFKSILFSRGNIYSGHNPASAWATVVMLSLALGLGVTGYLMSNGGGEILEEAHEILAHAFAFVVVAHIAGLILHTLRHRDGIAWSMISGNKEVSGEVRAIQKTRPVAALGFAVVVGIFAFQVYSNYDPAQGATNVLGVQVLLGEGEQGGHGKLETHNKHEEPQDHNDDE